MAFLRLVRLAVRGPLGPLMGVLMQLPAGLYRIEPLGSAPLPLPVLPSLSFPIVRTTPNGLRAPRHG